MKITIEVDSFNELAHEMQRLLPNQHVYVYGGQSVRELQLPQRTVNALLAEGISTVAQLAALSDEELLRVNGLGVVGLQEINKVRQAMGRAITPEEQE